MERAGESFGTATFQAQSPIGKLAVLGYLSPVLGYCGVNLGRLRLAGCLRCNLISLLAHLISQRLHTAHLMGFEKVKMHAYHGLV